MATIYQNLSTYDPNAMPPKTNVQLQKYAIAVADWNAEITHVLLRGAYDTLVNQGVYPENLTVIHVPGAFELTYAAKTLVNSKRFEAVIVLGCVIQGDTPHFDYVCQGVTYGIAKLNAKIDVCPVIFGVLTTNTLQQALDRADGIHGNKGTEAAVTAIKMANIVW
ncbi:MAG: 6,7-dimethyl-8-ribityllumazine synthase [Porphyromonadaceae bacterium CG2_30_38_12]|nr:MAG: 6,7-dimethyl-8-ribityllumazine synthase [Porphyromonadaceae bacterium CG2_30_38_12]